MLLTLLAAPCLGLCAGWQTSAHARMACCTGSHEDESQASVDTCCATGEHRQNTDLFSGLPSSVLLPADNLLSVVPALLPNPHRFDADQRDRVASTTDRHLLLSVFLI
jgi:hypothetical protein